MIYAKSNPKETLREHTEKLINNYYLLKEKYGQKIQNDKMWDLLLLAVKYHDTGKIYTHFQNVIRKKIGKEILPEAISYDIPHNYLSPVFVPFKELELNKDEKKILIQAIGYHHERDKEIDRDKIKEVIEKDLKQKVNNLKEELEIEISNKLGTKYVQKLKPRNRIKLNDDNYNLYVLVKGLLHRIDHSASAHQVIELDRNENVAEYTLKYMDKQGFNLREVQRFAKENKERNLIIIASTGIGKTESALFWIDNDKGFFTLPLRVSINALFDRVKKDIEYDSVGLLHSTSLDYLDEEGYENWEEIYEQSKILSSKLNFTTIDQIFKFPFKYRGYEKIYATMSYSKVVIDEIQAYSPNVAAVILKGLEMIHEIGGKFMIMTATLPTIYLDYLKERRIIEEDLQIQYFLSDVIRHKISILDKDINKDIDKMIQMGKEGKVLVIVNTVDKAIELYNYICEKDFSNTFLLHSMFIQEHRAKLENKIKEFAKDKTAKGIWITTQLVEASIDVDFDYLFTELSTLDSLFQRLGRCYRKRKYDLKEPNVYVYTEDVSGIGSIYDKEIFKFSKEMILDYDMKELSEKDKVKMVEKLYSKEKLNGTKFMKDFKTAIKYLDTVEDYDVNSKEAQKILRDIQNITVIPREIYDSISKLIEKYQNEKNSNVKRKIRRKINRKTVSIPVYKAKGKVSSIDIEGLKNIKILERKYDFDEEKELGQGILIEEELENIF
ncbi:CRISPR-associated helicase/endonuclease Cas3 [Caldisalinibacter kiritimatiensis]|uniref:CRISPR-associated helicase Cas3 n=1 Tax=Caldisalinibacter kiritimatiensis TaxID=1304284 RepID=R1AX86_9FIRM|nr:CRISPR-associated helicase/endonuclease Cas3 [Caldisalinibacter kiritimatiensis]EOD01823.1 CRISPR-associated helicase Cas3 [Caldisalinibacter kiritimatiensis]